MRHDYRVAVLFNADDLQAAIDELSAQGYLLHSAQPYSVPGLNGSASEKFLLTMEKLVEEDEDREPEQRVIGRAMGMK